MRKVVLAVLIPAALAACSSTPEMRQAKDNGFKEVVCVVGKPGSEYLLDTGMGVVRRKSDQMYVAHPTGPHGEGVVEQFSSQGVGTKSAPCDSIEVDPFHKGGTDIKATGN